MVYYLYVLGSFCFSQQKTNKYQHNIRQSAGGDREKHIDGLRYILAALVAYAHVGRVFNLIINRVFNLIINNDWGIATKLSINAGSIGVALFFIISGYLFASLKADSDWIAFFVKRFFRIAPIFTLSSLCCIVIASYIGFRAGNTPDFSGIIEWLNVGMKLDRPPIWGYEYTYLINSGVTWTLEWEWMFYFTVPVISILIPLHRRFVFGTFIIFLAAYIYSHYNYHDAVMIILFACGFCIRHIPTDIVRNFYTKHKTIVECSLILLLAIFFHFKYNHYSIGSAVFFGLFFLFISAGASLFGLLNTSGFVRLGDASYSIYLLHGIFWFVMTKALLHFNVWDNLPIRYGVQTLTWLLICYTSLQTYRFIELPAMNFAKRFRFTER